MNFLVDQTGLPKTKIKYFFKNLRMNDYRTKQKHIKTMNIYQRFSTYDKKILEEKFRISTFLDKKGMANL